MSQSTTPDNPSHSSSRTPFNPDSPYEDDTINFHEVFRRLRTGIISTLGLGLLGFAIAASVFCAARPWSVNTLAVSVVFSFDGLSKGEYPDHSKFQPDDLRSPDIIADALKHQGVANTDAMQSTVRAALTVDAMIPTDSAKQREKMRTAGQVPPPYIADEYLVTLKLPQKFPLTVQQRAALLREIPALYREKFLRTYAATPQAFGSAFATVRNADFTDYELILGQEIRNVQSYLTTQLIVAKSFRSPTTNLSFDDLLTQVRVFSQTRVNEVLGIINQYGLSKDRGAMLTKLDYYIKTLENQENKASQEEAVIKALLTQVQDRTSSYVLGIKSQNTQARPEGVLVEQGLIDSLIASDSYNMLVRKALDTGMEVRRIQADKIEALDRRKRLDSFIQKNPGDQSALIAQVQKIFNDLEVTYGELISAVRKTQSDFARQQFADAVRISDGVATAGFLMPLVKVSAIGLILGIAAGMGLSLIGVYVYVGPKRGS